MSTMALRILTHYQAIPEAERTLQRLGALIDNELRDQAAALVTAFETIRAWHGPAGWSEYQRSPEMQEIHAAMEALRTDA